MTEHEAKLTKAYNIMGFFDGFFRGKDNIPESLKFHRIQVGKLMDVYKEGKISEFSLTELIKEPIKELETFVKSNS